MEKNQYPKPDYGGFKHPIFQKMRRYIRFAKEHMALCDLESDCIHWEVKSSATTLNIPTKYHIHYFFKSIVSIDEGQNPVYGNHHILELTLPKNYPIEPCRIYLISDIWHPNIKSEGKEKGRVCANAMNLGKAFTLDLLVIRIGEILQYKNYHAKHVPPSPKIRRWPNGLPPLPNRMISSIKKKVSSLMILPWLDIRNRKPFNRIYPHKSKLVKNHQSKSNRRKPLPHLQQTQTPQ